MNSKAVQERSGFTSWQVFDASRACPLLNRITTAPEDVIAASGQLLKHDRTTTVAKVDGDGMAWVIKRYNTKNPWHAVRRALRRSRALNCWDMSGQFLGAGITVPAPVACIENKLGPFRGKSYFVYEFVDAEDLLSYMNSHNGPGDRSLILRRIEDLFDALQTSRIIHGDMKATNILVGADRGLTLLDLDAARQPADLPTFDRGHFRDRSRFLRNWDHDPDLLDQFESVLPA